MTAARALTGLKIVDLSRVLAGPYCTAILSDHGAEVIKIEPPQGDDVRHWGPPFLQREDGAKDASYFLGINRNKRSIMLDLTRKEAREVLLRLLEDADLLIENFKTGTMARWGLGYEEVLRERFPSLIHCRISGFGADGPLGGLPGYDAIVQAMSGLMSINGNPATGPLRIGTAVVDMATGLNATIGILMALEERRRSGKGQSIEVALHDAALSLLHPAAANWFLDGKRPKAMGNEHSNIAPYETYTTATGEIFLAIGNDSQFYKLCRMLGRPDMADDPRFRTNPDRIAHRPLLMAELQREFAGKDGRALCQDLLREGLPAGPVLWVDEALTSDHTRHREMVVEVGGMKTLGTPIKFSRTPGGPTAPAPRFASATREVLRAYGFSAEQIDALKASGAIGGV
jgi:formyl-CoA transferase